MELDELRADNARLRAALSRMLESFTEPEDVNDILREAREALGRCPECGHAPHTGNPVSGHPETADWCMVIINEPCEDCGAPTQRCRCTAGKAPQGGGSPQQGQAG